MDDKYKINVARTEMREAYQTEDVERLLAVYHPDGFTDLAEGSPSSYGSESRSRLREEVLALFASYAVKLTPITTQIAVADTMAFDRGWDEFTLTPKGDGQQVRTRYRYVHIWRKDAKGDWKIALIINNADVPENVGGILSTWFLSENAAPS